MTRPKIVQKPQAIFRGVFDDESIVIYDEMTAKDVPQWDSLNHINIVIASEQRFGVKFTTKEDLGLKNVGEFIALIQSKQG